MSKTRREEQIKAAHDEAMFGASSIPPSVTTEDEIDQENKKNESSESAPATSLLSDTVRDYKAYRYVLSLIAANFKITCPPAFFI